MTDARTAAIRAEIERLRSEVGKFGPTWFEKGRIAALGWVLDIPDPLDRRDEAMRLITEARDKVRIKKETMLECGGLTWVNIYEQQIRFADEILAALVALDAAMKPQEST